MPVFNTNNPNHQLIPPQNYGMVEEDLHRFGLPQSLNFPFLDTLQLKSVIYIAPDDPSEDFTAFLQANNIQLFHLGKDDPICKNHYSAVSNDVVIQALDLILKQEVIFNKSHKKPLSKNK